MPLTDPSRASILYVDDEELARKYFALALADESAVLTADGVDQALALLAAPEHRIGVLVTDYRMPGRAGADLLRHVGQHYPHIVCLLVTAHADKDTLLDSLNGSEIFRVLEKPLQLAELRKTMRLACARARERQARRDSLRAIDETLAFLAHELNTPLAAIANFTRGIERRAGHADAPQVQAEIGQAALQANDNARYCLAVLNSFFNSVRLASGAGTDAAPTWSSAHELLTALLDVYPLSPQQRRIISVEVQQDFAIAASPNCVTLVLSSILSNALRALQGRDDAELRVTLRPAQIQLSDNGPGIPAETLARLLVDPLTTHADNGGNGWGLIFCQRIMQSFGGSIRVQSEPGCGTSVTLNFPAIEKEIP